MKEKLTQKITSFLSFVKNIDYVALAKELVFFSKFFVLVIIYLFYGFLRSIGHVIKRIPFLKKPLEPAELFIKKIYNRLVQVFNASQDGDIGSIDLIILATGHLNAKKNRTVITIGGMAIGFGSVIFLLSLGYGVQNLVVSRIARLDEMKQTDVTVGQTSTLYLDDDAINTFSNIENVESVLPLVSVVSKVTYNNSVSDVVAYGVTADFLKESALQPSRGKIFEDGEILSELPQKDQGEVAGAEDERTLGVKMEKKLAEVNYSIYPLVWKAVYERPSENAEVIGYTQRVVGESHAIEVWGNAYSSLLDLPEGVDFFENEYSPWISDDFPIWKKETCAKEDYNCVDGEYLIVKESGLQQIKSGFITENDTAVTRYEVIAETAPIIEEGEIIDEVQFAYKNSSKIPIYSKAESGEKMLQLFTGQETNDSLYSGELLFGESYYDSNGWGAVGKNENGRDVGLWIRAKIPLWRQLDCQDCEELFVSEVDDYDQQIHAYAFIPANSVEIENLSEPTTFEPEIDELSGSVLGEETESAEVASGSGLLSVSDPVSTQLSELEAEPTEITSEDGRIISAVTNDDGTIEWVSIASGSAQAAAREIDELPFADSSQKVALVNRAMLNVLGILENEAVDKKFEVSLSLDNEFFKEEDYQAKSLPTELTIIGVIPEEKTPAFYLPFSDVKNLGVQNYSQLKVVVGNQNDLAEVRREIESLGYKTASVVDTVGRINDLFGTIRILLSVLGLVALSVAALGMFNTLTVSLLEKTREVGLMKAIGMKSSEVKRLFLAESIIIGLLGGIFGLALGVVSGYALSFILSSIAITKGLGFINIVSMPIALATGILLLSFVVGVATGLYPASRATKISALNALRYE